MTGETQGLRQQEHLARRQLAGLGRPGDPRVAAAVESLGPVPAVHVLGADPGEPGGGVAGVQAGAGVRFLSPAASGWPSQLMDLAEPPVGLWVEGAGDLRLLASRSVAVVGSRDASQYGREVAWQWCAELAAAGWCVVSGAAFGIDAAAHQGALAVGGPTVAVVASGLGRAYPRAHEGLLARIAANGAVVSEVPPGSAPRKHWFLLRNRLIAALTRATLVVEAGHRSGALSTAARAAQLCRVVMAVPGPVTSARSAGPHRLIREQAAVLVSSAEEVMELLGPPLAAAPGAAASEEQSDPPAPDAPSQRLREAVLRALSTSDPLALDDLAERCGASPFDVLLCLGALELSGAVASTPEGWRRLGK